MKSIKSHTPISKSKEPIIAGFLKSVISYPDNNALFVKDEYYSYQRLWQLVLGIHRQIPSEKKYERIGIYCSDDVMSYAALLAINLYGAAYVPLNSKYPVSKNKNSIEQCRLQLIITSVDTAAVRELEGEAVVLLVDNSMPAVMEIPDALSTYQKVNQDISYILFTSGSTGEPKGVPVSHANVNHCFNYFLTNYDLNDKDKFLQVYELTFDVSVFSFFMPLLVGACCYVLPSDGVKFMRIIEYLQTYKITVVSMVPTVLRYIEKYLPEISLPDLRYSFFSGDALYHALAVKWSRSIPNAVIHNFYGPTETTIVCTRYVFDEQRSATESVNGIVPLGVAFEGMETIIIDENNLPVEKGELCFTGTQVISAYLNNSNEDRFFVHQQKRYYKTGDVVSMNAFGNFVFHGRTDSQVKINGYRIELAEIENAVSGIVNATCVAVCKVGVNNINQILVFIETKEMNEMRLKEMLFDVLPEQMIPHQCIAVEKFPLNTNGKVDKQHLLNFA